MQIEDVLQALPSKEDIVSAIGLGARTSRTGDITNALGIFGAGIILGAGLTLLFAPKAGEDLRHDIAQKLTEFGEHLRPQKSQEAAPPNGADV